MAADENDGGGTNAGHVRIFKLFENQKIPQSQSETVTYDLYEQVVKECETCSKLTDAPPRSKVSGMRAEVFGDIIFVDYGSVKNSSASARTSHHKKKTESSKEEVSPSYDVLIVLDDATTFIYATPLDNQEDASGEQG